jgi:trk system potassium uptake protein TrkH
MYVGGLGIITAGTIILLAIGRRITLADRVVLRESTGASSLASVASLGWRIALFATAVQLAISLILAIRFLDAFSFGEAIWQGLFLSVSSFNNAGFTILPGSSNLSAYQGDLFVLVPVGLGIVLGGVSFPVLLDVVKKRRFSRWSLDTRLVVLGTIGFSFLGVLVMILFELSNQATIGGLSGFDKVSNILFQSVTSRTSGFSTIDFGSAHEGTSFIFMVLMFVGGAAGSTAGGVKVNAMMVLIVVALASIRGRRNPEIFKREIPFPLIARALALLAVALGILIILIVGLAITESSSLESGTFSFLDLLFEAVSAFGTNGLSRGITGSLTDTGQLLLIVAMYVGRLGPLTIALGLALRERRAIYRFTKERVRIG